MEEILEVKKECHSVSCACELQVDWNISFISGGEDSNGFIVQELNRKLYPLNILDTREYNDIHYFEAWKVKDGCIIDDDKGSFCDDMFCIGYYDYDFGDFRRSLNTKGKFEFLGIIYWVPETSPLYNVVNEWSRMEVTQSNGLKATYDFPEANDIERKFTRQTFEHSWDLIGEENIYQKAKVKMFNFCKENTERDRALFLEKTQELLGDDYDYLARRLIEEWELQWQN